MIIPIKLLTGLKPLTVCNVFIKSLKLACITKKTTRRSVDNILIFTEKDHLFVTALFLAVWIGVKHVTYSNNCVIF